MNIVKHWNGQIIRIRQDRYVSLTDMAKASGKLFADWNRLASTKSYLATLSRLTGIPIDQLIEINESSGSNEERGTWGLSKVAIRFAQWCSDEFALQVDMWIEELLIKGGVDINLDGTAKYADTQGFVYLAMTPKGWYKIGMSKQPYRRMLSLQTGTPLEITLIHRIFTFNCKALEKALHEHYSAYWMRGEWFELPQECIDEFPRVANQLDTALEQACLPTG